jgi:hypothetical protein
MRKSEKAERIRTGTTGHGQNGRPFHHHPDKLSPAIACRSIALEKGAEELGTDYEKVNLFDFGNDQKRNYDLSDLIIFTFS